MTDPRYTDGYIVPTGSTTWKFVETGPGNGCVLSTAQMTAAGTQLRLRKVTNSTSYSWASNPPNDLSPTYWYNFTEAGSPFPVRDKDAVTPATVVWAGVYPTNLRDLVVVWDGPVSVLDRTKIIGAVVSSVEGRVMHLLLPNKVAIDGSTQLNVTFQAGSVGVYGLAKDTNLQMYSTPPVSTSAVMLSADTLNDTTDIAVLQDSSTKNAYIHAFYGTTTDTPVIAQCWQQFEPVDIVACTSTTAVPAVAWMLCYTMWGTTVPMDLFPPEQLMPIPDIANFGTGSYTARLTTALTAGTFSYLAVEVLGAAGPPVAVAWPTTVTYTPNPSGSAYTDSLPAGTMVLLTLCAAASVDGNSQPVAGGGGSTAIASAIVYGGDCVQTASPFAYDKPDIYSLARFPVPLDPAKPVDWTKLDLPITFNHGDPIPQRSTTPVVTPIDAKWPNGIGLARLCRGSPAVGSSTWNADVYATTPLVAFPSVPYYAGFKSASNFIAYVYFDKPPVAVDNTKIKIVIGGVVQAQTATSAVISSSTVIVTFTPVVAPISTMSIRFQPGGVTTNTVIDSSGTSTNVLNTVNVDQPINCSPVYMTPVGAVTTVTAIDAIYDPASPSMLSVYFSGPLQTAPASTAVTLSPAGTMLVSGGVINGSDNRRVDYTISTPTDADLSVAVTVAVASSTGATLPQGDIPSGPTVGTASPLALHVKAAKNCYVLICNRYTEKPYYRGDVIDVATDSSFSLADQQTTPVHNRTVYDSRARELAKSPQRVIVVLGGNAASIGSSMNGIVYNSSLTPTAAFDPNVDTVYDNGLGNGDLWTDGLYTGRVLVRHNYLGHPYPIISGTKLRVASTATLNYTPGGGGPAVPMLVYLFDWL